MDLRSVTLGKTPEPRTVAGSLVTDLATFVGFMVGYKTSERMGGNVAVGVVGGILTARMSTILVGELAIWLESKVGTIVTDTVKPELSQTPAPTPKPTTSVAAAVINGQRVPLS